MQYSLQDMNQFNPKRNLVILCIASFVVVTGFGVIIPFFPIYADDILHPMDIGIMVIGTALQIGILTSAFMFARFFLAPSFGNLSDSSGRKPIILVGMTLYGFLMVGFGLSYDFLTLLIVRILQGIASAAVWPVGEALIVDTSPKEKVGTYLGYYIMAMQGGTAVGPFLAYIFFFLFNTSLGLSVDTSYRLTFVSVGVLGFMAAFIIAFFVTDPITLKLNPKQQKLSYMYKTSFISMGKVMKDSLNFWIQTFSQKVSYRNKSIYSIYGIAIINGIGFALVFPIVSLFLQDAHKVDEGGIALILGIVGVLALTGGPVGGYMSDRIGRKTIVWITELLGGIALILMGLQVSLLALILILGTQRFVFAIIQPSFRALQNELVPPQVRGKEFGLVQASFNLGSIIGPIVGGYLYDLYYLSNFTIFGLNYYGVVVPFGFAAITAFLGGFLVLLLININRDKFLDFNEPEINSELSLSSYSN
ncbi:MAG: MFS transporter [Candidatus Thorarchaeota archaeon]